MSNADTPLANGQASSSSIVLNVFNELWLCTGRLLVAAGNDRVPLTHGNLVKRCQLSAPFPLKRTWEGAAHLQDLDKIHEELPQKRLWPPFSQMSMQACIVQDSCAMGLVRICHGLAPHVMKSHVPCTSIQKPRERLWVASELAGTFLPFADTENQFLSTFDSPSFRTHNKSHNLKTSVADPDSNQDVGGGTKASGCHKLEW